MRPAGAARCHSLPHFFDAHYRKLTLDMRDLGENCGTPGVARLLKLEGLRSQTGCRRRPGVRGGKPAVVAPNHLQRRFTVTEPNQAWVTGIAYILTHEGWLYLAVVVDLFSRQAVGCAGPTTHQAEASRVTRTPEVWMSRIRIGQRQTITLP